MNIYLKSSMAVAVIVAALGLYLGMPAIHKSLEQKSIASIEERYGSQSIPADQEARIRQIAQAMGIADELRIRKMNDSACSAVGYCNAFFIPSNLWDIFPLVDIPFLYISAGFLEDLSESEQQFLIGHELIHLRDRHNRFLPLFYYGGIAILFLMVLTLLTPFTRLYKRLLDRFAQPLELHYLLQGLQLWIIGAMFYTTVLLPTLGLFSYKRHLERCADVQSVALLNSHQGGIAFMDRYVKELGHSADWSYWQALNLDHPSYNERKQYILAHQHNLTLHS